MFNWGNRSTIFCLATHPNFERKTVATNGLWLVTERVAQLVLKARHNIYEYGDKDNRLLAHQIHRTSASRLITKIQDSTDNTVIGHREITILKQFYIELYISEGHNEFPQIDSFLNKLLSHSSIWSSLSTWCWNFHNRNMWDHKIIENRKNIGSWQLLFCFLRNLLMNFHLCCKRHITNHWFLVASHQHYIKPQ